MSQPDSPYRTPDSALVPPEPARPLVQASRGRRLGTLVIDYLMFQFFRVLIVFGLSLFLSDKTVGTWVVPHAALFEIGLLFAYYAFFEGVWSRTPGKWMAGTIVVDDRGRKPSFDQVIGRTLCRFIPFEPFSFLGQSGTGWHDRIPRTRVVMAP